MTIPTDEQLMAWADGELDEQTSTSVAEAVANSPELAAKVEIYRATGRILGDTIARGLPPTSDDELASSTLAHPLPSKPPHAKPSRAASVGATNGAGKAANGLGNGNGHASNIIGVIGSERAPDRTNGNGNATTGTASNGNGTVVRFPGPKAKRDRDTGTPRSGWMPKSTHAAGMAALVVGALAMTLVDWHRSSPTAPQRTTVAGRSSSDSEGAIGEAGVGGDASRAARPSQAIITAVLERTPSGQRVAVDGGWTLSPTLTFPTSDARHCREYAASRGSDTGLAGVACRSAAGNWSTVAEAAVAVAPPTSSGAASVAGRSAPAAVEEAIRRLQDKDALEPAQEADLIARGWK